MSPRSDAATNTTKEGTMNKAQKNVLESIVALEAETGLPVTVREVSERSGYASASGADRHLAALEEAGWIKREPLVSRSIRATRSGRRQARKP